jgi:hypothetical protein
MRSQHLLVLALATALASPAFAATAAEVQMASATAVATDDLGAQGRASFLSNRLAPSLAALPAPDTLEFDAVAKRRVEQRINGQPLEIGFVRELGEDVADSSRAALTRSGRSGVLRFSLGSAEAKALRAGFAIERTGSRRGSDADAALRGLVDQLAFRFGDADGAFVVAGKDITLDGLFWSPVVEGESMTVEVSGPLAALRGLRLRPVQVSHFDIDPAAPAMLDTLRAKIGESDSCQIDSRCITNAPSGYNTAKNAVARMVYTQGGSSFLCTGTLLNNSNSPRRHLFWSAQHCIGTQTVANTLQTYWFYEASSCGGSTVSSAARTLTGGAFLRHSNSSRDTLLLELKSAPPSGATYAGWSSAAIGSTGTAIWGIHHPSGDVKKTSRGSVTALSSSIDGRGPFYRVRWTSGVTEGGSSGSALYTVTSSGAYQLRGGLYGGLSFCSAPSDPDYYSRFSDVYASFRSTFGN